jgi:hypothetical protein
MNGWRGKWAVVTGSSSGIGWALAEELAAGGTHLVLTARRRERLEQLAAKLRSGNGVSVEIVSADLEQASGPEEIFTFTEKKGIVVDLLVNNAGFGAYGEFCRSDLARQLAMVKVNCLAVIHLTYLYLPGMLERRRGDIMIVASTAGFQAVPYSSTYGASKGFDLLFAEALAEEVQRYGLRVCALCPGPTATEFHVVAGSPAPEGRSAQSGQEPHEVARVGLRAVVSGKYSVVPGFKSWLGVQCQRILPRRFVSGAAEMLLRPKHLR